MTAKELKQVAVEIDATASALDAHLELVLDSKYERPLALLRAFDEIASLQAYAHAMQADAKKEGAA